MVLLANSHVITLCDLGDKLVAAVADASFVDTVDDVVTEIAYLVEDISDVVLHSEVIKMFIFILVVGLLIYVFGIQFSILSGLGVTVKGALAALGALLSMVSAG